MVALLLLKKSFTISAFSTDHEFKIDEDFRNDREHIHLTRTHVGDEI